MQQTETFLRPLTMSILCFIFFVMNSLGVITRAVGSTSFVLTNETDHQALLGIKDLIPEDPFLIFGSWNRSIHFCKWEGVTCGRKHQRVTVLDLSSQGLVGSLSPHIGNLTFLRKLDVGNNSFHGTIPREIGRLFRLQELWLWNNSFQGELPTNLANCSNLKIIFLHGNNLEGEIPTGLGYLTRLLQLVLSLNNFTGSIPASFGNLSTLTQLSVVDNNLGGSIPLELGQLSHFRFLQLSNNNFSGTVPTLLYNTSSFRFFAVSSNQLHGTLPPNLGLTLPNLQGFYFGGNNFYGPVPSSISNASGLVQFDIAENSFTGPMPMNLGSLPDLDVFNVYQNLIGTRNGNELEKAVTPLSNCSKLRLLLLGDNQFRGPIPHSVANLSTNLNSLYLDTNYLSGSIPPAIGNLVNLRKLALKTNMLTGSIPDSIGKLTKLQQLYIDINNISGEIPSSIGNLTGLILLDLHENMLERSIPISLGNCTKLLGIDLGYNQLTGVIPENIFGLSSLSIALFLDHNHFSGPLPLQVGNLRNLGKLDLSENNLSGEIPATLSSFQVLESLFMAGNHFEGTIPGSFEQLKGIQVLDLSRNNLSGQIPTFFGEFNSIQFLNLSYNNFEGQVPNEGLFQNTSDFSVVGNSKLCGGLTQLQLPVCQAKVSKKRERPFSHRVIIPVAVTSTIVVLLLCLAGISCLIRRSRRKPSSALPLQNNYPKLSYAEIHQATNGFSSANLIGEGRYSSVFKGILNSTGQIIAVKVLKLQEVGGNKSFLAECEALKSIRHRNLVKIITSCSSIDFKGNDFKALVFEFMKSGSLESWLYPRSLPELHETKGLNLVQRLNMAIDVASALDYLHHQCEQAVIHCDLKPSNVLLDDDLCAHVSDFGLARILSPTIGISDDHRQSSSIGIRGTIGYVAPEYGMGEDVSTRGDMYSYGVLLLEMFIGKRPTDNMFTDSSNLHNYAKMSLENQVMEIIDPQVISEGEEQTRSAMENNTTNTARLEVCLKSILQIGVSCCVELPSERMNARDVLTELNKIRTVFLGVGEQVPHGRRNDS